MTKDVISLSISVLLLFRHYISHKITLVPPAVAGYYAVLAVLLYILRDHRLEFLKKKLYIVFFLYKDRFCLCTQ